MTKIEILNGKIEALGVDWDRWSDGIGSAPYCLCGCQETTGWSKGGWSNFRPGHDARLISRLLRAARAQEININDAIEVLGYCASDKMANKLRRLWLRVR